MLRWRLSNPVFVSHIGAKTIKNNNRERASHNQIDKLRTLAAAAFEC